MTTPEAGGRRSPSRTAWSWIALALVLAAALAVGASGRSGPPTDGQRAHHLATEIRCPTCRGLSAAESDAPSAQFIRDEILRRVTAGQSDAEILRYVVSRYGTDVLLKPEATGIAGLVWALPAVALVLAAGGLVMAFRRWRARPGIAPTDADRALVDKALER